MVIEGKQNQHPFLGVSGYKTMPLLNPVEVNYLLQAFQILPNNKNQGFYTSLNHEDSRERLWVDNCVQRIVGPKITPFLKDYEPLFGTFTIKKPSRDSTLAVHLDWSVVDEETHNAIGVWVPLCDVTPENGAFGLLEGSWNFGKTLRGSMINFLFAPENGPNILSNYISKYRATQFSLSAGTAIVYDMRTAHFSSANKSNKLRLAVNLVLIPKKATPLHFFKAKENEIRVFKVDKNYFLKGFTGTNDIGKSPIKTIEIQNNHDIEEQHQTDVSLGPIESVDLRNKVVQKACFLSICLNRIKVKLAFRKFMRNEYS